jgi:hypothetical protein
MLLLALSARRPAKKNVVGSENAQAGQRVTGALPARFSLI